MPRLQLFHENNSKITTTLTSFLFHGKYIVLSFLLLVFSFRDESRSFIRRYVEFVQ